MIDRCAKPGCGADFRLFNSGDVYALERRSESTEFFWLCSECAPQFDLLLNADGRPSFHPRGERSQARPANPELMLRLVSPATRRIPSNMTAPSDEPRSLQNSSERSGLAN
jgi:hypothetical protein